QEDRSEDAQVVPVRDESDITLSHRRKYPGQNARSAGRDLFDGFARRLAADHTVPERRPVVAELGPDLFGGATFVSAVVPLDQQRIDVGLQSCELCGATSSLQGRAEHETEVVVAHQVTGGACEFFA